MDTRTSPIRLRINQVREELQRQGVYAVLVPSADPHLSEYLPGRWQGREWFSGFTGSMATLIIAQDRAVLFADSRYWVQAEAQLVGSGIDLEKIATGSSTAHIDWLATHTPRGSTVVVDGQVLGLGMAKLLQAALQAAGVVLRTDTDLLGAVWPDRPIDPEMISGLPSGDICPVRVRDGRSYPDVFRHFQAAIRPAIMLNQALVPFSRWSCGFCTTVSISVRPSFSARV